MEVTETLETKLIEIVEAIENKNAIATTDLFEHDRTNSNVFIDSII